MPIMTLCYYSHRDGLVKSYLDSEWEGFEDWIDYIIDQINRGSHLYEFFYLVDNDRELKGTPSVRYKIWKKDDFFPIQGYNNKGKLDMDPSVVKIPDRKLPVVSSFDMGYILGWARNIVVEDGEILCDLDLDGYSEPEDLENLMELMRVGATFYDVKTDEAKENVVSCKIGEIHLTTDVFARKRMPAAVEEPPPPPIDYKQLLRKYIEHVAEREGTSFLRDQDKGNYYERMQYSISNLEWDELQRIDKELNDG